MLNGKVIIIHLIAGLIKKTVYICQYFPKLKSLRGNIKAALELSYYATKGDLKNAAGVDTSELAKKTDFANLS